MKLLKGYPDKIIFKTDLGNTITVSCGKDFVDISYLTKQEKINYIIRETKQEKLVMNK
ncbi:MAG: hypothetical protein WC974_08545 [Thermoplasmata archaeon]